MKIQLCDNTDCSNPNLEQETHKVKMKEEFGGGNANWCKECIKKDKEMLETAEEYF